ncbi:hypothetical protein [Isoptericola sp. NPDC055881]
MTTRRLDELPAEHAAPILELLEQVRAAAAAPEGAEGAWAAAEAGQARIRTGHKAARRTLSAGQCAAHALRLTAAHDLARTVDQAGPDREGASEPWTAALAQAAGPIDSWDWDERMQGALDLRRTFKDLPEPLPATVRPVRAIAAWLTHAGGAGLIAPTARLAALVLDEDPPAEILAASWYATHGPRLLAELTSQGGPTRGAADADEARRRDVLRTAVRGVHAARIMSKTDLAAAAGITRRTLDAWTAPAQGRAA